MRRVMMIGGPLAGQEHLQQQDRLYREAACEPAIPSFCGPVSEIENAVAETVLYNIRPVYFENGDRVWLGVQQPFNTQDALHTMWVGYRDAVSKLKRKEVKFTEKELNVLHKAVVYYGSQMAFGQVGCDDILNALDAILKKIERQV